MTWLQAIFLALVQGITELFPVSSLGHAVIIPSLLNWKLDQASDAFLPFLGCRLIKSQPQSHGGEFCESQIG